jgi:hypothetical protein
MCTPDSDTFLVALYTIADDLYAAHYPETKRRVGAKPVMSDSEVMTIGLCVQWLKWPERKLLKYVKEHWRCYFPRLLSQPEYNRRFNALADRLASLVPLVRRQMTGYSPSYEVLDCVPVVLMKRCRGERGKLFGRDIANIGKGGSDQDWYYGIKLALSVTSCGRISGFILVPAKTSERWSAEYLLCYRHDPSGKPAQLEDLPPSHGKKRVGPDGAIWPKAGIGSINPWIYLTDRGFKGQWWEQHWQTEYKALVLTPDSYNGYGESQAARLRRLHSSSRQVIETVNEHLSDDLGLNQIRARTQKGLLARIAAKLAAFNIAVWLNGTYGRPTFAIASLFSF